MPELLPIEPPEMDGWALIEMAERWVADPKTGRVLPEDHIGAVAALDALLGASNSQRQRVRDTLRWWLRRRCEEHGYCPHCLHPLERQEWVEQRPRPFGEGTVGERMSETYCPVCEPERAKA